MFGDYYLVATFDSPAKVDPEEHRWGPFTLADGEGEGEGEPIRTWELTWNGGGPKYVQAACRDAAINIAGKGPPLTCVPIKPQDHPNSEHEHALKIMATLASREHVLAVRFEERTEADE